jgi:hypothetical protein
LFVTVSDILYDGPEYHRLDTNEDQNCLETWFEFLLKFRKSLIGWRFSLPGLCANFSETHGRSNTPAQNNVKDFKSGEVGGHEKSFLK